MRLGQYRTADAELPWCGVSTDDGGVINLPEAGEAAGVSIDNRTTDLLADWKWRRKADLAVEHAMETGAGRYDADAVSLAPPVSDPQKIVCVGLNYREHAEEGDNPIPDEPVLFQNSPPR